MPNRPPKLFTWVFLSALVAWAEIDASLLAEGAFRQYLADLSLREIYGNFLVLSVIYGAAGGLAWFLAWLLSWLGGRKGERFFTRNSIAVWAALFLAVYGVWAVRKFLAAGFVVSFFVACIAPFLGIAFQKVSFHFKRICGLALIFVTVASPFLVRLSRERAGLRESSPNLVLLSVDTLRPDHLGFMGYSKAVTPSIDRLASEGIAFRQAYAQIPLTAPSFCSILTGLYPKTHGCRANLAPLNPAVKTLAEIFSASGYRTAAFVSGYPLKRELSGLSQGFHLYQDRFSFFDGFKLLRFLERWGVVELQLERRADGVSALATGWMRRHAKDPFFVWIHYYDPHVPYRAPARTPPQRSFWGKRREDLPPGVIQTMTALYDGEIGFTDRDIGKILLFLEGAHLRKKTLIVFVSDHGEGMDHDYYFDHGDRLYESCIRIPLIFSYPGVLPENILSDRVVQSIDLFPTVLSLLKFQIPLCEGTVLFEKGLLSGDPSPVYTELSRRPGYPTLGDLWSVREGPWKLIYSPEGKTSELYDVVKDPGEEATLSSQEPERVKRLTELLLQWMGERKTIVQPQVEGLAREKLKSLGYLQ